jgi:hypothetical protein
MTDIDVYKAREEHLNETVRMWYKAYSDVQERLERPLRETILAVLRAYAVPLDEGGEYIGPNQIPMEDLAAHIESQVKAYQARR